MSEGDEHGGDIHPPATEDGLEEITDRPGATVSRDMAVAPGAVMAVLLRAETFPIWVVGPGRVVAIDPDWPAVGSGFLHETGRGPLRLRDRTIIEHVDREGGRITVEAMFRPAGRAAVQLHVLPRGAGSRVVMHERPISGPGSWLPTGLYRPALTVRNLESLRRLERLAREAPQQVGR